MQGAGDFAVGKAGGGQARDTFLGRRQVMSVCGAQAQSADLCSDLRRPQRIGQRVEYLLRLLERFAGEQLFPAAPPDPARSQQRAGVLEWHRCGLRLPQRLCRGVRGGV
jgi:hypothetical protein